MSLQTVLDNLPDFKSDEILKSFVKGYSIINNPMYKYPVCSISGGSDSDIMLDIIHRIDEQKKVAYVWFDTGLEYKATKDHLKYLENRYAIKIIREKAVKPIPVCTREYGQPFFNKFVSEMISRLQCHDFDWTDNSFDDLYAKYPKCKIALQWWCNFHGEDSKFNISRVKYMKEFLIENPPQFKISSKCCTWAKKMVSKRFIDKKNSDLMIVGVRKFEGGIRAAAYKDCYTVSESHCDEYRPLFWFTNDDKQLYAQQFNIVHSDCYTKFALSRTGCVCCPYGKELSYELFKTKIYEPNMYKAVSNVFSETYEYTKKFRQFVRDKRDKESGKKRLF